MFDRMCFGGPPIIPNLRGGPGCLGHGWIVISTNDDILFCIIHDEKFMWQNYTEYLGKSNRSSCLNLSLKSPKNQRLDGNISQMLDVWNIYLHLPYI